MSEATFRRRVRFAIDRAAAALSRPAAIQALREAFEILDGDRLLTVRNPELLGAVLDMLYAWLVEDGAAFAGQDVLDRAVAMSKRFTGGLH